MMHRCSSSGSHGVNNMVGQCSCGLFGNHHSSSSCFSMLLSSMQYPNHTKPYDDPELTYHHHPYSSSSSSSSVDCTLSLGTPSTRLVSDHPHQDDHQHHHKKNRVPNFCWDVFQTNHTQPSQQHYNSNSGKINRVGTNNGSTNSASDPLLARRCANCDTTSTPLWRNGPRGPKSLCNACGIRFKKEERRATAAAATSNGGGGSAESHNSNMWVHHAQSAPQKMTCFSPAAAMANHHHHHHHHEFRFMEDDVVVGRDSSSDGGISFLSWRLNVTDRPGLVHDFTR